MGRGQGQLDWGPGRIEPEGSGLGVDNRLPSASVWAVHWAAPALKVTFTGTPGYGPDFARGGPWKGSHGGHTRARSWGHVRAHAVWFQGAPLPQADGIGGPTPLRAPAWGALRAGDADT